MTRNARPVALPLELAPSGAPLRHRVADAVIELLRTGHLGPGDTLPATRALAAELGISRTAVLAAYDELAAAGFIHAVGGSSTIVSPGADLAARAGVSSHVPRGAVLAVGPARRGRRTAVEPAARLPGYRPDRSRPLAGGVAGGGPAARLPAAGPSARRMDRYGRRSPCTCAGPAVWPPIPRTSSWCPACAPGCAR